MKIYIGIVFMSAFVMSIVLIQNFVKNIVAYLKFYESHGIRDSELFKGWMVWATAILWAVFIIIRMHI
jgi:hypothetical protein